LAQERLHKSSFLTIFAAIPELDKETIKASSGSTQAGLE
jgi:hypothetical protein